MDFEFLADLLDFIEVHKITDEVFYANDARYDVRSKHFSYLIAGATKELDKLEEEASTQKNYR